MVGLEKTKAKAGEVSQSARALSLEDMHRLYDRCMNPDQSEADRRRGVIRYVSGIAGIFNMSAVSDKNLVYRLPI